MSAASAALASLVLGVGLYEHQRSGWTPLGWPEPDGPAAEEAAAEAEAGHECPPCECVCEEPALPAHRAWLRRTASSPGYTLEGIPERRLWADADRPRAFVWGEGNHWLKLLSKQRGSGDEEDDEENDDGDDDDDALDDTRMSLLPPPERRGAGSEDSDSDSLEDEEFADMERLMEELDQAALQEAQLQR